MANPFLMMDEDIAPAGGNEAANPFLVQDEHAEEDFENPFIGQATNPFADFGDEQSTVAAPPTTVADIFMTQQPTVPSSNEFPPIDPAMSFFGTTIDHDDDTIPFDNKPHKVSQFDDSAAVYSSEEELSRRKAPPPRPVPPSQTTQELIYAVADQLDQASSHLLGRLPKTRSPSPVSMRDLHSPSPTPDGDLLDVSDGSHPSATHGNIFDVDLSTENPFAPTSVPPMQAVSPVQAPGKSQPPRPPPPRPVPPRPAPPGIPSMPMQQAPAPLPQEPDLFDMFGDTPPPRPAPPKTKEDILSLFAAPAPKPTQQQAQLDFLSGDILLDDISTGDVSLPPPFTEVITQTMAPPPPEAINLASQAFSSSEPLPPPPPPEELAQAAQNSPPQVVSSANLIDEIESIVPIEQPQPTTTITAPEQSVFGDEGSYVDVTQQDGIQPVMDSIAPEISCKRAPTPDIEITTVESLPRSDDEEESAFELEKDDPKTEAEQSSMSETNMSAQGMPESPAESTPLPEPLGEPEQMDTGLDFAPSIPSGSASVNPFASPESEDAYSHVPSVTNIFTAEEPVTTSASMNIFGVQEASPATTTNIFAIETSRALAQNDIFGLSDTYEPSVVKQTDEFDAFSAKFDSVKKDNVSLLDGFGGITPTSVGDAWGEPDIFGMETNVSTDGFGVDEGFDSFLAMKGPEPEVTMTRKDSGDSLNEEKEFSVVIRPKEGETMQGIAPILAPPPRGSQNNSLYSGDSSPRINPFDKGDEVASAEGIPAVPEPAVMTRTDSQETPPTPLFDDDVSQPLEDFPRVNYAGHGWDMQLRQPNKKKITGQRFWKKIFLKLVFQGDNPVLQLFNQATDKEPFQELPLQPCYSVSDIGAQQYDQFGKIFTVKLQYIFYKERPGVRPGQVTKAERLTNKLSQFAAYAIQGDYQGVKEFGSDLKKLGLPVEHAPQVSQLFKIGSMSFEDLKQFSICVEEALFKISAHRDRALTYKFEEVQITAVDELYAEQEVEGHVSKQIARVRLFFLGFLSGMPSIELGLNDMWRQGKEVVGRHDIIPVVTEEWIRLEGVEFHNCVQQDEYERSRTIKFQPPDACYIELMRFRVRPPKNRELPLQLKATWCVTGNRVELRADVLVPGFASRKLGQIPCEDVAIRFPIPECWIYLFRVEKHFRYGSVKSAHRRTGKIKGIERILGTVDALQESLIEVTSGQAKYEHQHRSIVWRCPRLPKEGQGAYTTHQLVCRMALTSYDQIPEQLAPYCYVEFTMPATQVSHTTVRSVSVQESDSDEPPEKYVRYLARHEYRVGIESTTGESPNAYLAATRIKEEPAPQPQPASSPMAASDSDSESN